MKLPGKSRKGWKESREEQRWREEFRRRLPTLSDEDLQATLRLNLEGLARQDLTTEMALRLRARLYVGRKELKRRGLPAPEKPQAR